MCVCEWVEGGGYFVSLFRGCNASWDEGIVAQVTAHGGGDSP